MRICIDTHKGLEVVLLEHQGFPSPPTHIQFHRRVWLSFNQFKSYYKSTPDPVTGHNLASVNRIEWPAPYPHSDCALLLSSSMDQKRPDQVEYCRYTSVKGFDGLHLSWALGFDYVWSQEPMEFRTGIRHRYGAGSFFIRSAVHRSRVRLLAEARL